MKCKKHPTDQSSSVGVCASCLRGRLFALVTAQTRAQALERAQQDCRKSDTQRPPLSFPRSVSPYIFRRNSDTTTATWQPHGHRHRFYSTPQVGPNGAITVEIHNNKKSSGGRFYSLFLGLFRSKSENKPDSEPGPISDPGVPIDSWSASPAWFSTIIPSRRKKKIRTLSNGEKTDRSRCRGMSPERHTDNGDEHCQSSGYSSDSQGWRQTPQRMAASTRQGGGRVSGHNKSVSSLGFCLSPLVRPSPNNHWNQKVLPPEMVVSGESKATPKPHFSTSASLCKNRSRKLVDFGRYAYDTTY